MQNRSDKEYKAVMVSVQEDVIHLNNLIRKLLELAKAGAGKGISLTQVRVDEIVIKAAEEIKSLYKEYHVNCSFEEIPGDESLCYTFGNEELLFIAFKNIIENACKYSSAHQAWISLKFLPDKKIIHIKDKGIGMTKEDMKKILEPFFRSQNAEFFSDGFGLGLAMSSQIIRLHKGKIEIESEPGKGSTFTIILPEN
jgi:signal transduction histidine kinase